jgi:cystathionine beta-lyase/cystathionine gamma-synthase
MEKEMKLATRAVHAGDRKRNPAVNGSVPATTPIYTASSWFYNDVDQLDRVFAKEMPGQSYARYSNPTNDALEELVASLESGAGALACSSGMAAVHMAVNTALMDRRRVLVASNALYGATINMLAKVLEPAAIETIFIDFCDEAAVWEAIREHRPGALLMETISNPLLRVPALDRIAEMAQKANAALIVDNTFATPLMLRPLELGATFTVHSLTKYLSGHGDVLGGVVVADAENLDPLRMLSRTLGFTLGPFEAYLSMRGIKTFPIRMERQCANACRLATWLATHPAVERVYFPADPKHADAENIRRLFPANVFGAMISFELKDGNRERVFRVMNALRMIVPSTSLGDVHTMMLYPAMSSHRDISPKHRQRLGIKDNLLRISTGIEAFEDIESDLDQALRAE